MATFLNELHNYQNIPRALVFDSKLSDRARFLYCYMACKPDGWQFFLEPMSHEIGYGIGTLRKYINELVSSGWIERGEQENKEGVFGAVSYTLKACDKNTVSGKMRHGKNDTLYNKDNKEIRDNINNINTHETNNTISDVDVFIERMYKLYPTKCPKRNSSLGKSTRDKKRISKLLKMYTMQDIEKVFKHEIDEKLGKQYMQNFSTFLNNFPDPSTIESNDIISCDEEKTRMSSDSNKNLIINGQIYR